MKSNEPVLCYVSGCFAYFTTQELSKQWGDDWDDAPYEHNAGEPYKPVKSYKFLNKSNSTWEEGSDYTDGKPNWEIIKVAFDANLVEPSEGAYNSMYSVEQINKQHIAWLRDKYGSSGVAILAGTTINQFIKLVKQAGGTVYLEDEQNETT